MQINVLSPMPQVKWHAALFLLLLPIFPMGASAEPPFRVTETAHPIALHSRQIETGFTLDHSAYDRSVRALNLTLRYGLTSDLEVGLHLPYLWVRNSSVHTHQWGDMRLHAKARLIRERAANPLSIATALFVKIPSAGNDPLLGTTGRADIGLFIIASKPFPQVAAHAQVGYVIHGRPVRRQKQDQFHSSIGIVYAPAPRWAATAEVLGEIQIGHPAAHSLWSLGAGLRYLPMPRMAVDLSLTKGLTSRAPDWGLHIGAVTPF